LKDQVTLAKIKLNNGQHLDIGLFLVSFL